MRLMDTQTVDGDVAFLTYERVRDASSTPLIPGERD
jgi:hypothetical protein